MKKIELLAPAGGKSSAKAAVQSGANAIYLGGPEFNARQSADNFTIEEMKEIIDYCHLYGVLVYVTVNTLIKERETAALADYAKELNRINVDGVIVQDLGAVNIFKKTVPDLPIHGSTQMTITDSFGVSYLNRLGIKRVVLARELSKERIREIAKSTDSEIEIFVHGALCMCYSGQCMLSSIIGGRSGNRGRCAQPCRLSYTLLENGKSVIDGFLLSPKDLNLSESLQAVKNTGSVSLKIEGRLKRPEYVATVVSIYRKYLDAPSNVSNEDKKALLDAFNRGGFTKGFFANDTGKSMMCHDFSGNLAENRFSKDIEALCREDANFRKIPIYMYAKLSEASPLEITMWDDDNHYINVVGETNAETANNKPLDSKRLKEQLQKLGSTPFMAKEINADIDDGIILPVSEINSLRRKATELLEAEIIKRDKRREIDFAFHNKVLRTNKIKLSVQAETKEQALCAKKAGISRIYVPETIYKEVNGNEFIPMLSEIATDETFDYNKMCVENISQIEKYKGRKLYGGVHLNVYNSYTAEHLNLECITISPELNVHEIKDLTEHTKAETEVIAYGRLTLMLIANCPVKACGKCAKNGNFYSLKDRKNEEFPLLCSKNCVARLINSKPLYMADKWDIVEKTGSDFAKLVFTTESLDECEKITNEYITAINGKKANSLPENTFTRGHFLRGVE